MKLLYLVNIRLPTEKAHGIQIMQMLSAFANSKLKTQNSKLFERIELVIPRRFNKLKVDPFEYYGVKRNFAIKKLPCLDLIPLDKYIGHLGLWVECLSFFISALLYLFFKKADIFYTRDKLLLPLVFLKKNFFFEAHTFPRNYFLYKSCLKKVKGIIVITKQLRALFLEKGIAPDRILLAPDAVDLPKFDIPETKEECRRKLGLLADKKIVLYTGHLYEWKGAGTLLQAARNFQFLIPNFQTLFIFVGGTEADLKNFKLQISSLKLDNVLAAGHRPHSEIPYWLKAADVLVLPNSAREEISRQWTSPLKMFEYMASQQPIVASDLPSLREVLNERNCVLTEPDNPSSLAVAIKTVLANPITSEQLAKQAYNDVQLCTWQERAQKILDFVYH